MRTGNDGQATVCGAGVHKRKPNGEEVRFICFRVDYSRILMPTCSPEHYVSIFITRRYIFGKLYPNVLDRIGIDLSTNDRFCNIKNAGGGNRVEYSRTCPEWGVRFHPVLRKREVEILVMDRF